MKNLSITLLFIGLGFCSLSLAQSDRILLQTICSEIDIQSEDADTKKRAEQTMYPKSIRPQIQDMITAIKSYNLKAYLPLWNYQTMPQDMIGEEITNDNIDRSGLFTCIVEPILSNEGEFVYDSLTGERIDTIMCMPIEIKDIVDREYQSLD